MKKNILPLGLLVSCGLVFVCTASLAEPIRLPGMAQEIEVKSAKDLSVKAPSGERVAVLDQSIQNPKNPSTLQDHHNGWLQLSSNQVEGNLIKVKGLYYVPRSIAAYPDGIRFTVRKRTAAGLPIYADKTVKVSSATDKWVEFTLELPLKEETDSADGKLVLLLSALPLAGPIYLDNLQVTDSQGNQLWDHPDFE